MNKTILIVDDHKETCRTVRMILEFEGHTLHDFQDGSSALEFLEKNPADVVLLDLNLGESRMGGMAVLEKIRKSDPLVPVIILTGDSNLRRAVEAIKSGAYHYITKPFDNEELVVLVEKAAAEREKSRQIEILKETSAPIQPPRVLGKSPALREVLSLVEKIAPTELTVVIQGESGSGKELFARLIHTQSSRREGPFVSLDCGTLQETLVESELFGYEKGAFTGADRRKLGLFEVASGGTLFLDEIGNLQLSAQAKLLRVLQERKLQHLGGSREIPVDARLIVASNRNLEELAGSGKFREDLFHRLNQMTLWAPPLRKRSEDVPDLAAAFLESANLEMNRKAGGFSREAMHLMQGYSWPGNIRELKNAVYRAALLADAEIKPQHLQLSLTRDKFIEKTISDSRTGRKVSLKKASRHAAGVLEKQLIEQTLKRCGNNKSLAARKLRIDRKALYNKLKKYKLK